MEKLTIEYLPIISGTLIQKVITSKELVTT